MIAMESEEELLAATEVELGPQIHYKIQDNTTHVHRDQQTRDLETTMEIISTWRWIMVIWCRSFVDILKQLHFLYAPLRMPSGASSDVCPAGRSGVQN
jgi:hypothetical protein